MNATVRYHYIALGVMAVVAFVEALVLLSQQAPR